MQPQEHTSRAAVLTLDEFPEGTTPLELSAAAAELELSNDHLTFAEPVQVTLSVSRCIDTFTADGLIRCPLRGECCRCLTAVEQGLEIPLRVVFQRKEASEEELEAVEDEEFEILSPGTREIDLKEFIRAEIVLELPLRVYCSEDCKGLCPQCGRDLNRDPCGCEEDTGDPRWAALSGLQFS